VSETLKEIVAGVKEAQTYAEGVGATVNPAVNVQHTPPGRYDPQRTGGLAAIQQVDFDVAVSSTDATQTQAGAGIFVAALGLGVKDKSDTTNSSVSRIKFSVPIVLPSQHT
jgi:hypothetical protein